MLSEQEETRKYSRQMKLSGLAAILLVVVVCAVSFTSTGNQGELEKKQAITKDVAPMMDDMDMARNDDGFDGDVLDDEYDEDDDLDVAEADDLEVEDDRIPRKLKFCLRRCSIVFKGRKNRRKRRICKLDCKADYADSTSPKKCMGDCRKACFKLFPPSGNGKFVRCAVRCERNFCPRPLKACLGLCQELGMKQFKQPKLKNIKKCKRACVKNKRFRSGAKKCKAICKKTCKKLAAKPKVCRKDCKVLCPKY